MNRYNIGSEVARLRKELLDSNEREKRLLTHIDSIEKALVLSDDCLLQYQAWFRNHEHVITPRPEPVVDGDTFYHPK